MSKVKDFFKGWSKFELCWLVLSTVIMIVLSIIWGDNTLALISGITGILGVVLAAKGKVSTYFFATINVAIYAYLTFNNHLWGIHVKCLLLHSDELYRFLSLVEA